MSIPAALVKELRDRTGSGMMECKKALQEADGDLEQAVELMRKSGLAKADKKAGRTTAEGAVLTRLSDDGRRAVMVEINSETDFVAKSDDFQLFADAVIRRALDDAPGDRDALLDLPLETDGEDIATAVKELVAKVGENIHIRRVVHYHTDGAIGAYVHGGRIGVLVELEGGDADLAKDLAMHIAASHPLYVRDTDVPADVVDQERRVIEAQSETSGKSPDIVEKMVQGRLKKYLAEITLLGQPFVKDPDTTVGKLLESSNASVVRFHRFEVGEGVEKKSDNFADEVMAQVRDSGQ